MKTLHDNLILFDAECPMCQLYTQAFVSTGLLEKNGRTAYQEYPPQACPSLDWQRAVNEIALINQKTGEVSYGITSLFKVCSTAMPALKPLFQFKPFIWLMAKFYAFVSYNRRVIIPAPLVSQSFQFQPSFKKNYRIAYLIFSWFITAFVLSAYGKQMSEIVPKGHIYREYMICGAQIIFQAFIMFFYKREKLWDYLGNLMTVSLAGALLLLPILVIGKWINFGSYFYLSWFLIVVSLMFFEHFRRAKLLQLGYLVTFTWILYRIIVLIFIFKN